MKSSVPYLSAMVKPPSGIMLKKAELLKDYILPLGFIGYDKFCEQCGSNLKGSHARRRFCTDCSQSVLDTQRILKYGVDRQMFAAMYFEQDGACAICRVAEATCVDHDQNCCRMVSDKNKDRVTCKRCVRGLLCNPCNRYLSYLENPEWTDKAQQYLEDAR